MLVLMTSSGWGCFFCVVCGFGAESSKCRARDLHEKWLLREKSFYFESTINIKADTRPWIMSIAHHNLPYSFSFQQYFLDLIMAFMDGPWVKSFPFSSFQIKTIKKLSSSTLTHVSSNLLILREAETKGWNQRRMRLHHWFLFLIEGLRKKINEKSPADDES